MTCPRCDTQLVYVGWQETCPKCFWDESFPRDSDGTASAALCEDIAALRTAKRGPSGIAKKQSPIVR